MFHLVVVVCMAGNACETLRALAPALHGKEKELRKEFERHLERKVERDLL